MGKNLPKNYRPISLASICSKLLEHLVYSSISRFCEEILTPRQHGFRPGFTCETQLVAVVDTGLKAKALNSDIRTDVAIFDFSSIRLSAISSFAGQYPCFPWSNKFKLFITG